MTQNEIIEMAKEAFIKRGFWPNEVMWKCWLDAWIFSAQHEREACAKVCEEMRTYVGRNNAVTQSSAQDCAAAIRARGQA
jgi:hypothetical protein